MKLTEKMKKVNDNFTVHMYDNGYMIEINGRDEDSEWVTAKILCKDLDELFALIKEAAALEKD
jgi:hypothetical protein